MTQIVIYIVIAVLSASAGFLIFSVINAHSKEYVGTMIVYKQNEDDLMYSLELDIDPLSIQYKKEITFKVNTSDSTLDRE